MNFEFTVSGDEGVLKMEGAVGIEHAEELRKVLIESIERSGSLVLDIEQVDEVDLSALQLLCSAQRSCVRSKKKLTVRGAGSQVFQKAVQSAGCCCDRGCALNEGNGCFWTVGERGDEQGDHDG